MTTRLWLGAAGAFVLVAVTAAPAVANHELPEPPEVQAAEDSGYVDVFMHSKCAQLPSYVEYRTVDDTAKAGEDYTAVSGSVTLTEAEPDATFRIPILDDGVREGNERVAIVLNGPRTESPVPGVSGGGSCPSGMNQSVEGSLTILDDESIAAAPGSGTPAAATGGPAAAADPAARPPSSPADARSAAEAAADVDASTDAGAQGSAPPPPAASADVTGQAVLTDPFASTSTEDTSRRSDVLWGVGALVAAVATGFAVGRGLRLV